MLRIKDIIHSLEEWAPVSYAEDYDNVGLLTGDQTQICTGALVSLDCTEAVIDEAIAKGANLIVSHHPIIFKGLKRLTGGSYVERTVEKAIANKVALYAIHTNLDHVHTGVNRRIADKLGLLNARILAPKNQLLENLAFFVPLPDLEKVRNAVFNAGCGNIGNYSHCSFTVVGEGSFRPKQGANPTEGKVGSISKVEEARVEVIYESFRRSEVLLALRSAHPYEEVAHYINPLNNTFAEVGAGMIGNLERPIDAAFFLAYVKERLGLKVIRHTVLPTKPIAKVAVCGGSGAFLIKNAIHAGADAYITADIKYHEFFDADKSLVIADIGHYESERFTIDLIGDYLKGKFTTFATHLTAVNTNPIDYF